MTQREDVICGTIAVGGKVGAVSVWFKGRISECITSVKKMHSSAHSLVALLIRQQQHLADTLLSVEYKGERDTVLPAIRRPAASRYGMGCKKQPGNPATFWLEMTGGTEVEVSLVWMQGRVTEVRKERGISLRLTDDTHTFTVFGADRAPKGKPCLEQGRYVMIMGIVLSCNPEPVLRAVKITDLSDNAVHQSMWKFEVDDMQKNMNIPSISKSSRNNLTLPALQIF